MILNRLRNIRKGVLSVGKRKRTNGCLLYILKMAVVSSFVLLMSFFGLYLFRINITEPIQSVLKSQEQELTPAKDMIKIGKQVADELTQELTVPTLTDYQVETNNQSEVNNQIKGYEEVIDTTKDELVTYAENKLQGKDEERNREEVKKETSNQEGEKVAIEDVPVDGVQELVPTVSEGSERETLSLETEKDGNETNQDKIDIPVYSRYELTLSDYVIEEVETIYAAGEVNVGQLVGQYFSNMSIRERLNLVNMVLGKLKSIDVTYVWGMVADGITDAEVVELQRLIEENFTEEEIDELYMYYAKSELAQLE